MDSKKKKKSGHEFRAAKKKKGLLSIPSTSQKIYSFFSNPCNVSDLEVPIDNLKNANNETKDYQIEIQQEVDIEKIEIQDMEVEKLEKIKDGSITAINAVDKVEKINVISMFCKPSTNQIRIFFSFHPIQPHNTSQKRLPFNENIFFGDQGNKFNRRWLTYDEKNEM